MTIPIPDHLINLTEITEQEIRDMIEKGEVRIEGKKIMGAALEALHKAIFEGVPVHMVDSLIDGDLDIARCPKKTSLAKAEGRFPRLREQLRVLRKRNITDAVLVERPLEIRDSFIKGNAWGQSAIFPGPEILFFGTTFGRSVDFNGATFGEKARFEGATFREGASFRSATFEDGAAFGSATFGDGADFRGATFGARAVFWDATFGDEADFRSATFGKEADFGFATFGDRADFEDATFGDRAGLGSATFGKWADFQYATFGEGADFRSATFGEGADFRSATFEGVAVFWGAREQPEQPKDGKIKVGEIPVFKGWVDFSSLKLRVPQNVRFQTVNLSQARFLNTRLDKIQFIDVDWQERDGRKCVYDEIAEEPKEKNYALIARLYRQLKRNYEEERDYPGAGDFHYGEMEMTLRMHQEKKEWFSWLLTRAYKFLSGYGEKAERAIVIALAILLVPALCYDLGSMTLNHPTKFLRDFTDYLLQSLGYMTFRIYETPIKWWWKILMVAQAILGPIQLALAALSLRRKFRR